MIKFTLTLSLALLPINAPNAAGVTSPHAPQEQQQQRGHADGGRSHGAFDNTDFDRFHDVLHPLQHDALPQNDYAAMRREARRLVSAGRVLTKGFVPAGVTDTVKFCDEQARFADALKSFDRAAKGKDDALLKASFTRVHDTFEEMAHMLPRR